MDNKLINYSLKENFRRPFLKSCAINGLRCLGIRLSYFPCMHENVFIFFVTCKLNVFSMTKCQICQKYLTLFLQKDLMDTVRISLNLSLIIWLCDMKIHKTNMFKNIFIKDKSFSRHEILVHLCQWARIILYLQLRL